MSALPNSLPERIPERLGRYEILLPIGTGGMATVYVARAEVVDGMYRFVAIKMMHPQMSADADAARQLLEEAKLSASIRHPNVVAVYEAAEDPSGVYMAMDYVEGETLSGLIRGARAMHEHLPLPIVGRILSDALSGLHAAHELRDASGRHVNLVHRDYSPSNILVGIDGVTRLADFGVAKAESRISATTTGAIKGKVGYMAPEQVLAKKLDRRCDVWAAGVVTWECLAGRRLHRGDHDEEQVATLFRIVQEEPPLLATVRPELPDELSAAIAAALTRDLESRCATAAELRRRLMDAWRTVGPVADAAEVGEYVERIAGGRLAERREQAARVLELRGQLARVSEGAVAVIHDRSSNRFSPLSAPEPRAPPLAPGDVPSVETRVITPASAHEAPTEGDTSSAVTALLLPTRASVPGPSSSAPTSTGEQRVSRPSWTRGLVAACAAAGLLACGIWMAGVDRSRGEPADASATAGSAASVAHTAAVAPEPSTSAPAPAGEPARLIVRASASIARLQVGQRTIPIARPAREVLVQLSDSEQQGPLRIEAATADGRHAAAQLASGAPSLDLVFPSVARPSSAAAVRATSRADSPPPLAPSPFGNR